MKNVKQLELIVLDLFGTLAFHISQSMAIELYDYAIAQVGSKLIHLELIVDDFPLCFLALDRSKLASADRVTNGNGCSLHDPRGATKYNSNTSLHHDLIDYLRIALHRKVAFGGNTCEAREQVCPGDSHMVEFQVAIVHNEVAKLYTDVTHFNTR